ncbi:hypothetical protein OIU76_012701 [Salix suchowensis]|uniref:Uncharacterized protein n=1 Tax=Salix suchowensis TaxID=1278906 RepID=A0ABQ8ZSW4_9ROSI|nr:hypothetical protein OIU77_013162 [Salix suchowensis]KAJ6325670.1 hypothetical protein OIU76_012701 [Salix suchowensis]KAJ6358119.1 hypothetical protein OIU78_005866 [Salix suchowensis]
MLQCLSLKTSSAASTSHSPPPSNGDYNCPPASQAGNSAEGTPRSSAQASPTVNLTREYTFAVQTNSYNETWSRIHCCEAQNEEIHDHHGEEDANRLDMTQILQPNRECVEEALRHAKRNTLTRLVSTYFVNSESTNQLCIHLQQSVYRARDLYGPLHKLLDVIPTDSESVSQSQCDCAFDLFLKFDRVDNPFPCPDSHNFSEMQQCFSQLQQQLERRIRKSRSRIHLVRRATFGSALCVIGSVVAVVVSAVAIGSHALVAIAATQICTVPCLPRRLTKKELAHVDQLDSASRGTYVLDNQLATLERRVARLYEAVECDKVLIRIGLDSGKDLHPISEVLRRLKKNLVNFIEQLKDLEEHICLCFNSVNKARHLLLQEVHRHQIYNS